MEIDLRDEPGPRFGLRAILLLIAALAVLFAVTLPPLVLQLRRRDNDSAKRNSLRDISVAIHAYESQHGTFPPPFSTHVEGNPRLNWRVLILPYLGELFTSCE